MRYSELNDEQRRQFVDARQLFGPWRDADREFRHSYQGSMHWVKTGERQYLKRRYGTSWESLGARSPETEATKASYTEQRSRLRQRITRLAKRLDAMKKINRAHGLGRVPDTAAKVLRKLDEVGLLGKQLFVVGTHSLYAYEARAGVLFDGGLTATTDIDLLWDSRRKLSLAVAPELRSEGLIGLLRRVDRSFEAQPGHYRAVNEDGYYVDLIRPLEKDEARAAVSKISDADHDMTASAIIGLQWLINAPKFDEIVIGSDGLPLWISCIDPRVYALHKLWMSKESSREPIKRKRDMGQAKSVAEVARDYLGMKFNAKDLSALPIELVRCAKELTA
ncbi:nucleotidyltransferase domain-containing protein [Hyphomicrobium sp. CS1GBMeth3]|uniref:GSU2403 family nucleotidyltransferase fold protein n=1 Tax=Hyphomicrobium sp. CS1GBMeth3 TaxID=1892845 RepID=UPI000930B4DF|nr:nucleotidyltransferase domain-containing protein [Hyphomicrobium sp. CS1GBMeth3]